MGEVDLLLCNCILQHLHGFIESARLCFISWTEKIPSNGQKQRRDELKNISATEEYRHILSHCFCGVIQFDWKIRQSHVSVQNIHCSLLARGMNNKSLAQVPPRTVAVPNVVTTLQCVRNRNVSENALPSRSSVFYPPPPEKLQTHR